jgi:hypothetical protein
MAKEEAAEMEAEHLNRYLLKGLTLPRPIPQDEQPSAQNGAVPCNDVGKAAGSGTDRAPRPSQNAGRATPIDHFDGAG